MRSQTLQRAKQFIKLSFAAFLLCAGRHAPDSLTARLQAIESALKSVEQYSIANSADFFSRLDHLPKEFRNVNYDAKTQYVDHLIGMMSHWSYLLRDASVRLHPERYEKDEKTAERYAKLGARYLKVLSDFHATFARVAHQRGVRRHGITFNQISWLKLRVALPVARKMQGLFPNLGRHAGVLNRVPLIEYGVPALAKMSQELSAIDSPNNKADYAKLVQFSAVQEMMVNRWALNRMNSFYGWTDKIQDRCTMDFMVFNGSHLYEELWNPDRFTDFMEYVKHFGSVALSEGLASQAFYRHMIISAVSDLPDMKVYVEANTDPDPETQKSNLNNFYDHWAKATLDNEQGILNANNINDILLMSSFAEDSFAADDIANRVVEALFEWRKAAAISQVYGYYETKIASAVEQFAPERAGVRDLDTLEKRLHASLDNQHDAFVKRVKPKVLQIAQGFNQERFQRERTEERFNAKVDELLTYASAGMIALTELSSPSISKVDPDNFSKTPVPYALTLAPNNPAELKTYFNAKVESDQGAAIRYGFKVRPESKKYVDRFFDSVAAEFKNRRCHEKTKPTDDCDIGRIAALEAEKYTLQITHERARERNLTQAFERVIKSLKTENKKQPTAQTFTKKIVFNSNCNANCHAAPIEKPVYIPTTENIFFSALELMHLNRQGAAPAKPASRAWRPSATEFKVDRKALNFQIQQSTVRKDALNIPVRNLPLNLSKQNREAPKTLDPSAEDPFSNRDIKASEFTNRDLIRTVSDHHLYANAIVTIVYTMSPMFRISFETGERLSSDPSYREAQMKSLAIRDSLAMSSMTPEERGIAKRRSGRLGGSHSSPFKITLNLLERLALAYDAQTGKIDKAFAREVVRNAIQSARNDIRGKLEDFCSADAADWGNNANFKKMFEAASGTRFSIIELEQNGKKKSALKQWDDEIKKEIRTFSEAIVEDWLDPAMTVFFYVSLALLVISIAAGNAAGFAVFMLYFDILWSGVGGVASYYKTRLNFYELPEKVAYNIAVAGSQIDHEGIADWGTVLQQRAQMEAAQDSMPLTYAFDSLFIGSTAFRAWKMIGKSSARFLKNATTLEVETRINLARKSDELALSFERVKPSTVSEFLAASRRNLSVLTQKTGRMATRLLESLPKYQKNFNADEMARELRVALMREVPNNPSVFLKELEAYGSGIEKKILRITNRSVSEGGRYSLKDLVENPAIIDEIFASGNEKQAEKIWKLIAKHERYEALKLKIGSNVAQQADFAEAAQRANARSTNSLITDEELFHSNPTSVDNSAEDLLWQREVRVEPGEGAPNFYARKAFVDMLDEEDILMLFEASGGSGLAKMTHIFGSSVGGEIRGSLGSRYSFLRNYFEAKQVIKPVIRVAIDEADPTLGVFLTFGNKTADRLAALDGKVVPIRSKRAKAPKTPVAETPVKDPRQALIDDLKDFYKKIDASHVDDASGF